MCNEQHRYECYTLESNPLHKQHTEEKKRKEIRFEKDSLELLLRLERQNTKHVCNMHLMNIKNKGIMTRSKISNTLQGQGAEDGKQDSQWVSSNLS